MAAKLPGVREHDLVGFSPVDGAAPYVEVLDGRLHRSVAERGRELEHRVTGDLDEFLHFPEDRDSRIGRLAKQIELLRRLDPRRAEQLRQDVPARCPGVRLVDVDAHPLT